MEFSRPEYWSGEPFPSPEDLPTQGLNPGLPHCRQILYQLSHKGSPLTGTKNGLSLAWSPQHSSQGLAPGWHHGIVPFNDGHRSRTGLWPFGFPPSTQLGKGAQGVCCSVAQSCGTLCNPMDCSTPDFPVLHRLPLLEYHKFLSFLL